LLQEADVRARGAAREVQHRRRAERCEQGRTDAAQDIHPGEGIDAPRPGDGEAGERQRGDQHQPADVWRVGDRHAAQDLAVDRIGGPGGQGGREGDGGGVGQHLLTHVLQRAAVQVVGGGAGRVVVELPSEEGVVQAIDAGLARNGEVRVVGHPLVDVARQRGRLRVEAILPQQGDRAAAGGARLEHLHPAAPAARFGVDEEPDPLGHGIALEEGLGAQEAGFLAVGDQHDHVAGRRAAGLDRPHGLQHRGDACGVVGRAGRAGNAVVVGHERKGGRGPVAAGQDADDVLHRTAADVELAAAFAVEEGASPVDFRGEPEVAHPAQQIVPGGLVGGRSDRMRDRGDGPHVHHGALCREGVRRSVGPTRRRRLVTEPGDQRRRDQGGGQRKQSSQGRPPDARRVGP
jgi:hypothetical protein